jgi:hypothetical protein
MAAIHNSHNYVGGNFQITHQGDILAEAHKLQSIESTHQQYCYVAIMGQLLEGFTPYTSCDRTLWCRE